MVNKDTYALIETLKQHARRSEGINPHVYLDPKSIPTIGVGYALGDKNGRIYSQSAINADLNAASGTKGVEYFTTRDMQRLALAKTDGDLKGVGPQLNPGQMEKLLDISINRGIANVDAHLANLGANAVTQNPDVRNALIDLSFRGGENLFGKGSPTLNAALQRGDMAGVLIEIKYGSNGDNLRGNDIRNDALVENVWKNLSPQQQQAVQAQINIEMQDPRNQQLKSQYDAREQGQDQFPPDSQSTQTPDGAPVGQDQGQGVPQGTPQGPSSGDAPWYQNVGQTLGEIFDLLLHGAPPAKIGDPWTPPTTFPSPETAGNSEMIDFLSNHGEVQVRAYTRSLPGTKKAPPKLSERGKIDM